VVRPSLRILDLFAGAGGLSEGFRQAGGFVAVGAVEADRYAAATFTLNHPTVDLFAGDVSTWLSLGSVCRVDVVVGGPPCQGFSNLGSRRARDPRNSLWRRYVDALVAARPRYFVLENVADFLRSGQYEALRQATRPSGRLRDYRIEAGVLNAGEFGVPQLRKRAVVLGSHRDLPALGLPVGHLQGRQDEWATVHDAIGDLEADVHGLDLPASRFDILGESVPGPFKTLDLHLGRRPTRLSMDRYRAIPPGGNRRDLPEHLLAPCWRDHPTGSGDVMGRLRWDRPSVTIRTEFWKPEKGRYLHPEADRALTHLEAARLQGFPDDYLWCGPKAEIGRQIGNAVPILLGRAVARHIHGRTRH
jgi:DNA (cytosine-5)-methyltransferase 1